MVKEKGKSDKNKKNIIKSNWDEDDISVIASEKLIDKKKKKKSGNTLKHLAAADQKIAKDNKINKKMVKKGAKKGSDVDDFGVSLDKLKEIDPEFYKVIT